MDFSILRLFFIHQLYQLLHFRVEKLKLRLQLHDLLLLLFVLVLLRNGKHIFELAPSPASQPASSFLDLLPRLKGLSLRYELLYFTAVFRVKLLLVEQFIEEALNNLHASADKGLVLAERYLGLHECEDAVFREGWEDVPWLFFGKDLSL